MSPNPPPDRRISEQTLADLRLLHLADSALPIGALAHSFGLETPVARELLDNSNLPAFLEAYLQEAGTLEAVFCRAAFRLAPSNLDRFEVHRWLDLNRGLSARKPARESRAGSASLGRNFLAAVIALGDYPALRQARDAAKQTRGLIHHSTAFGLASGVLALDEDRAVSAFLHQSVASLVSACQRLLPLGQSEATAILWNLKSAVIDVARSSVSLSIDDAFCFTPLLDWGAMEHPALFTRLFIS